MPWAYNLFLCCRASLLVNMHFTRYAICCELLKNQYMTKKIRIRLENRYKMSKSQKVEKRLWVCHLFEGCITILNIPQISRLLFKRKTQGLKLVDWNDKKTFSYTKRFLSSYLKRIAGNDIPAWTLTLMYTKNANYSSF